MKAIKRKNEEENGEKICIFGNFCHIQTNNNPHLASNIHALASVPSQLQSIP